jgi:hypothetical protein
MWSSHILWEFDDIHNKQQENWLSGRNKTTVSLE